MRTAIRDPRELCRILELPETYAESATAGQAAFPLFAPLSFVARMRRGDVTDPLLRQVLPTADEAEVAAGVADPVGDLDAILVPGLLQKYTGRALLITTGACAIHCRYCFRRHFPYSEGPHSLTQWQPALDELQERREIHEVLLSGGDPLSLTDDVLFALIQRLAEVPHLRRLRIHSRLPIVIPDRVTPEFINGLRDTRLTTWFVVHVNHPNEIDGDVSVALSKLVQAGIPTLNQAVLLRGVNDRTEVLESLCLRLCDVGVMPYYLHQLDRVQGALHFEVPVERGQEIMAELRERLPGYAVPRFVQECPGALSKTPL